MRAGLLVCMVLGGVAYLLTVGGSIRDTGRYPHPIDSLFWLISSLLLGALAYVLLAMTKKNIIPPRDKMTPKERLAYETERDRQEGITEFGREQYHGGGYHGKKQRGEIFHQEWKNIKEEKR